ncbi:MAG TPA: phospholipid carrier-dependent glycosyltransferase [Firmicutes bacterium]|nr:phospholipid carrier-dependent glycosyltransferase [Bacillota bacterium]
MTITPRVRMLAIVALALIVRIGAIATIEDPQQVPRSLAESDAPTYYVLAENLLNGTGYRYGEDLQPTAKRTPGYPLLIAATFKVFGRNFNAVRIVQCSLDVVTTSLIFCLTTLLFSSNLAGLLAALAYALYPPAIFSTTYIMTETLYTFLLVGFTVTLMVSILTSNRWLSLAAGILLGLATLTRPGVLFLPLCLLAVGVILKRQLWKALLIFIVGFLVTILPWGARNYRTHGKWIMTSTLVGANLYKGNHIPSQGAFFASTDSLVPPPLRTKLATADEATRDSILKAEAFRMIWANKGKIAILTLKKIPRLWLNLGYGRPSSKKSIALAVSHLALLGLAIYGLNSIVADRRYLSFVPLATIVFSTLAYLAVAAEVRFVFPLIPLVLPFAAGGFSRLILRTTGAKGERG